MATLVGKSLPIVGYVEAPDAAPDPPISDFFVDATPKCFLCDHTFVEGEQTWLIFEQRVRENGQLECSLSAVLGAALGTEVDEGLTHSSMLCDTCNASVLEFEAVEQRFCEIRFRIISAYNRTAQRNDLKTIDIEINGVLQDTNHAFDLDSSIEQETTPIATVEPDPFSSLESLGLMQRMTETLKAKLIGNDATPPAATVPLTVNEETRVFPTDQDAFVEKFAVPDSMNMSSCVLEEDDIIMHVDDVDQEYDSTSVRDEEDTIVNQTTQSSKTNADLSEFLLQSLNAESQNVDEDDDATSQSSCPSLGAQQEEQMLYEQRGDKYVCLVCSTSEPMDEQALADHMYIAHDTRVHLCQKCNLGFLRPVDLDKHIKEVHAPPAVKKRIVEPELPAGVVTYDCVQCNLKFTNPRQFRNHKRSHYTTTKHYECSECSKKYSSRNLLEAHMNMHTGARPYKCSQCPKDFASKYTLANHMKIHTKRDRPYHCDQCAMTFLNLHNLKQHKKRHVGLKTFVCEVCSKSFGTRHNLDVHQIVHTGERPFICRTCGKSFARRAEIQDHERIHTGERPFKCDMCVLAFTQRSNLATHKKTTHFNEKQHRCEECGRCFKRKRLLIYHTNATHTGHRPHKCPQCDASFVYPEHLKKHALIHSGTKPFPCEVCGKEFNSRDNRNFHRFVHSVKKPYECTQCNAGFMRKPQLLAHMKQTGHVCESIIMNQPLISDSIRSKAANRRFAGSQDKQNENTPEDYECVAREDVDELLDQIMEEDDEENYSDDASDTQEMPDSDAAAGIQNQDSVENGYEALDAVDRQLIKSEMNGVQYLQFEGIDDNDGQTLTWVGINETAQ